MPALGQFGQPCVERHTAVIADRGGSRSISQLRDLTQVSWNRRLDRKSSATLSISGDACGAQAGALRAIEPRRHELVLYRGSERVWEGPIVQTKTTSNNFTLTAHDIIEYLDFTALSKKWPNSNDADDPGEELMTERIREMVLYELTTPYEVDTNDGTVEIPRWETIDPPANILPFLDIRTGTTPTWAVTEAFQMTLGEHLYNLGRSRGVNFTALGRSLIVWDGILGRLRVISESDFSGDFEVLGSGSDFFNVSHVTATTIEEDEPPVSGHAANDFSYYGPWEYVISTDSEEPGVTDADPSVLNSQARRALSGRYPVPLDIVTGQGSSLLPSAGIAINQLVPGVHIPVRAVKNIKRVSQVQLLEELTVTENAVGETINASLIPAGEVEAVE